MVNKSILLRKISHVRHNLARLREKSSVALEDLKNDMDTQDIVLHNLQLAVQGCIDLGTHIIADEGWGVAGSLNEIFYILQDKDVLKHEIVEKIISMIGFRNILVHEYEDIDLEIVHTILCNHLNDIDDFLLAVIDYFNL